MSIQTINPTTGEVLEEYQETEWSDVESIIQKSNQEFQKYRKSEFSFRSQIFHNVAKILEQKKEDLAKLMALEMGKPLTQGRAEVEKCAWVCNYYADHAEGLLQHNYIDTDAKKSFVAFEPLGTVLGIMPWNYPLWQVFRFVVPTIMAGNAVILKHASNVTGCALEIEKILHEASLPKSLFRVVLLEGAKALKILERPEIVGVSLTGSTYAGKSVAKKAGEFLKKSVLELGGSDPFLILKDADLDKAAKVAAASRFNNCGQVCVAAKRIIVVHQVLAEFTERLKQEALKITVGDPLDLKTEMGPMARGDLRKELHNLVEKSDSMGAQVLCGGKLNSKKGFFYHPTVMINISEKMPVYQEELFGPVATVIAVRDELEAIKIANETNFGLGAVVFTEDIERGEEIAHKELQAGNCFVNSLVKSDPRLPFGGIKDSGYGRELGEFGIREFVNVKTIYVE